MGGGVGRVEGGQVENTVDVRKCLVDGGDGVDSSRGGCWAVAIVVNRRWGWGGAYPIVLFCLIFKSN